MSTLKINKTIHDFPKLSYAEGDMSIPDDLVDCSAGFNPYGTPKSVFAALSTLTPKMVCEYPHGEFLRDAIVDFWRERAKLTRDNVVLTNGSIEGIYLVNTIFATPGARLLSIAPQFSDYTTHAKFLNMEYVPVYLRAQDNWRFDLQKMLDALDSSFSLVYLDNPNNPTGQKIELDDLRALLDKAAKCGVCVISDEAYGDFMEDADSAVNLLPSYDNLVVLRTFSKGMGLAGMRAGYMLASSAICADLEKISNPYTVSQPSRLAAAASIKERDFVAACRAKIATGKKKLREALTGKLSLAYTLDSCPICMITHLDNGVDLAKEFLAQGVLTYSGDSFDGIGINSVRLRLPHEKEEARLLAAVKVLCSK